MKVAVYGSLKQGLGNHSLMDEAKFLGRDRTAAEFSMVSLGSYPMIFTGGADAISIEVYEIDQGMLDELDWLEGYPDLYERKVINTRFGGAWIYYREPSNSFNPYDRTLIRSGNWTGAFFVK